MAELIHQDMTFYYEIHGEGIPVLFLAGTMADHSIWLQNLPEFNNYQVILFDNRDVGQSSLASQPYGAKEMAADALALLQHLNLPAAHVIGHSLGGQIAQELYFLAPERVRSLILFNTWAKTDNYCASLFWLWQTLRDRLVNDLEFVQAMLVFGTGRSTLRTANIEALAQSFTENGKLQSADAFHRNVEADLAADTLERLHLIRCPTLVLSSEEDLIFPHWHAQQLATGIAGAETIRLSGVGHNAMLENSATFNQTVLDFLSHN